MALKHAAKRFRKLEHRLFGTKLRGALSLIVVVLVVAGGFFWYIKNPVRKPTSVIPSTTVTEPAVSSTPSETKATSSQPSSSPSPTPTPTKSASNAVSGSAGLSLIAPWGSFVSNHHPGQGGAPTTESSVCNTTPGASCYIKFTNGESVQTLAAKLTDSNGSVIWNWDVSNAGLASGSWKITAVATLNGQTKTTDDPQNLEIQ